MIARYAGIRKESKNKKSLTIIKAIYNIYNTYYLKGA